MTKLKLAEELKWRGLIKDNTFADVDDLNKTGTFYLGIDATADGLTVGNLAIIILALRLARAGWQAILLMGGGTTLVGDPGGKDEERELLSRETIIKNVEIIEKQVKNIFQDEKFIMLDNYDWLSKLKYVDFLRDVGKHFSMTELMQRDFVVERMGEGGKGISYAEFSYSLVQGYDYLYLHKNHGATLQIGGSDQWGNLLSGVTLIRKKDKKEVNALSMPLIVDNTTGKKFGKSEEGAVWLDAKKTSPYKFYQFWLNVDDEGVEGYLKIYTELDSEELGELMSKFAKDKSARVAQKRLAYEVTKLVHGEEVAKSQVHIADALQQQSISGLTPTEAKVLKEEMPGAVVKSSDSIVDILAKTGLVASNSEARTLLASGAVYINGEALPDGADSLKAYAGQTVFVRKGKVLKNTAVVEIK